MGQLLMHTGSGHKRFGVGFWLLQSPSSGLGKNPDIALRLRLLSFKIGQEEKTWFSLCTGIQVNEVAYQSDRQ